jgi:hypothetical protein
LHCCCASDYLPPESVTNVAVLKLAASVLAREPQKPLELR